MVNPEPLTPQAEKAALDDLLKSDGWAIVCQLVDQQFGAAAQLQHIDALMTELQPSDTDGQHQTVTQVRAASKAAFAVLALPASRLRQVSSGPKASTQLFSGFRRGPRTR